MFATTKLMTLATVLSLGLAAGPLAAQSAADLRVMDENDTSATMQADFDYNLDLLGVRMTPGETLTDEEMAEVKRIMNDESDLALKQSRIQIIVDGEDGIGINTDIDN